MIAVTSSSAGTTRLEILSRSFGATFDNVSRYERRSLGVAIYLIAIVVLIYGISLEVRLGNIQ